MSWVVSTGHCNDRDDADAGLARAGGAHQVVELLTMVLVTMGGTGILKGIAQQINDNTPLNGMGALVAS